MKTITSFLQGFVAFLAFGIAVTNLVYDNTASADDNSFKTGLNQIALMPFSIGKLESPDNPVEKPLSKPVSITQLDRQNISDGADAVMNRILQNELVKCTADRMISFEISSNVYQKISTDPSLDTLRKLAVRFGQETEANRVVVGTLWRFREKKSEISGDMTPASVAFALYLIDVPTGKRLWRGAFEGTQKALSDDIIGGLKQIKKGMRWLSVDELARYGVKQTLKKFPLIMQQ